MFFYIRREDRREGYPLETDTTGRLEDDGTFWYAPPKKFILPHGRGTVTVPHGPRDTRKHAMKRMAVWPGAPYEPTGNPLVDGIGPAAHAEREDVPDLTDDGRPRIVPFRAGDGYYVHKEDANPVGMTVISGDGKEVGKIVDIWVDRAEAIIRYFEVDIGTDAMANTVILPLNFANVKAKKRQVVVEALHARHFHDIPQIKSPDQITRLEEDIIMGYYGGGEAVCVARQN